MTVKKRLFLSNILMIAAPVVAALAVGLCCMVLLWIMLQGGGFALEDSWDFSWASRAVVKMVSHSLKRNEPLDALGETLEANGLRGTVLSGDELICTWGAELPEDGALLQAAEGLTGDRVLVSAGPRSLAISDIEVGRREYRIYIYGAHTGDVPSGTKLVLALAALVLLCSVLGTIWGTNRFLVRFVFRRIEAPLQVLSEGAEELGNGNLDFRIDYREPDEFAPVCAAFNEMAARLKASIDQTRRDEESRKELLAGISHDLRSPLTSIQAYVEGLLDGVARTGEAQRRYLTTIKTKAEDIDRMVSQLFLFSKLDMEEYPMNLQSVPLNRLAAALVEETAADYRERGLEVTLESVPVTAHTDPEQLRRVLVNILDNSVKYKERETGHLHILVEDTGTDCRLTLTDDGPSVPEEALPRLFDAFYRSDPARKNPAGGSGLGLAIADRTIRRMGGTIAAQNAPKGGLSIIITLPKEDSHGENPDY